MSWEPPGRCTKTNDELLGLDESSILLGRTGGELRSAVGGGCAYSDRNSGFLVSVFSKS